VSHLYGLDSQKPRLPTDNMHFTSIISILAVLATRVTASPMPEADNDALEERQGTASGCAY
jgi:hypothetical protein